MVSIAFLLEKLGACRASVEQEACQTGEPQAPGAGNLMTGKG